MSATSSRISRSAAVRASIALLSVIGFGTVATLATFSDEGSQLTTFSTGTVDIQFDGSTEHPTQLTTLALTNAKAGDVKYAPLTVKNSGTLAFDYTLATAATGDLADELKLSVAKVANTTACSAATDFSASGAVVVAANTTLSSVTTSTSRALAVAGSEVLCFKVELPQASTAQGETGDATFTLTATQS